MSVTENLGINYDQDEALGFRMNVEGKCYSLLI